jgi:hypothetical protein
MWILLSRLFMSDFCCTSKISAQTKDCAMSMVFRACIYYLETVKQSNATIVDLTNDQSVSMVVRTHICHFEAVKQASAVIVDLWITSRWVVGTVMWSHLFWRKVSLDGTNVLVAMKLICQLEPVWKSVAWVFTLSLSPTNQGFKTWQLINGEL